MGHAKLSTHLELEGMNLTSACVRESEKAVCVREKERVRERERKQEI